MIVSDNGTELTSHAILGWQEELSVKWQYIAPGKPRQYTGTRDEAIRDLRWECTAEGGCIDVEGRFIHRRGFGLDPSKGKPRATSRIAL